MVQWRHIVVLLLTAWLGGCGSYAMFDPSAAFTSGNKQAAWTGNGNGSANEAPGADATVSAAPATDTNASNSLFARASDITTAPALAAKPAAAVPDRLLDGSFKLASTDATAVPAAPAPRTAPSPQAADKITAPRGRAYLFRGMAGLIYSRGIDKLAARIRRTGIPASVDTYLLWRPTADAAIRDYRRDPQPITLIGHSMGGDAFWTLPNISMPRTSRSACSSPTIPPASPMTFRPMSRATSTFINHRISWAAAMSCKARASTAITRATI